ncbi:hypothetical protein Pfo_021225 [Paulownia fortunei]|nr:hypothetical protein Pfo_021225 [Paulownia fortunei]
METQHTIYTKPLYSQSKHPLAQSYEKMRQTVRWDFSKGGCPSLFADEFNNYLKKKKTALFSMQGKINKYIYIYYHENLLGDALFGSCLFFFLLFSSIESFVWFLGYDGKYIFNLLFLQRMHEMIFIRVGM